MKSLTNYISEKLVINKNYKNGNSIKNIINKLMSFKEQWHDGNFYKGIGFEIKYNKLDDFWNTFELIWDNILDFSTECDKETAIKNFEEGKIVALKYSFEKNVIRIMIAMKKSLDYGEWFSVGFTNIKRIDKNELKTFVAIWDETRSLYDDTVKIKSCSIIDDTQKIIELMNFIIENNACDTNNYLCKKAQQIINELK